MAEEDLRLITALYARFMKLQQPYSDVISGDQQHQQCQCVQPIAHVYGLTSQRTSPCTLLVNTSEHYCHFNELGMICSETKLIEHTLDNFKIRAVRINAKCFFRVAFPVTRCIYWSLSSVKKCKIFGAVLSWGCH